MSHQLIIHFAGFLIDVNQFSPALKPSCSAVVLISTLFCSGQKCRMVLEVSHAIVNSAGRSPTNATCVATQRLVGYAKIANHPTFLLRMQTTVKSSPRRFVQVRPRIPIGDE